MTVETKSRVLNAEVSACTGMGFAIWLLEMYSDTCAATAAIGSHTRDAYRLVIFPLFSFQIC